MKLRTFIPAAAAVLAAGTAAAQDADSTATRHPNSLSVQVNSSPTIGLWHRFTPRVEAGVEVFARLQNQHFGADEGGVKSRTTAVGVGPALKLYTAPAGPLQPYVFAGASVQFVTLHNEDPAVGGGTMATEQNGHSFNGELGLGLEWAPVERVRVGGHAGVEGSFGKGTTEFVSGDVDNDSSTLSTFSSGVRVQFYF